MMNPTRQLRFLLTGLVLYVLPGLAPGSEEPTEASDERVATDLPVEAVPELTGENSGLSFLNKVPDNLLLVPIPTSSPTFGTGLILGGAWFYGQTEEQKAAQPASFTAAAAGYTNNDSWFAGVMQQNYWGGNTWRFTGVAGYMDFKLELKPPEENGEEDQPVNWLVDGPFLQGRISRKLWSHWYLGVSARYLDITQFIDLDSEDQEFLQQDEISVAGVGAHLDFDSRDMPYNPFKGRYLELKALYNQPSGSGNGSYQAYHARFRSYHLLADSLVLAWDVNACSKTGDIPMWDTCRLALRGFPATEYLARQSLSAQAEIRWRFFRRLGMVAFGGAGRVYESFGRRGEDENVPSYGVGIRFMLLESQRINLRVDYARSDNGNDAWYLSVTEAF